MAEEKKQERPKYELAIVQARDAFIQVADKKTWEREFIFAVQTIRKWTPEQLKVINLESIKNAVMNIALTGATLNPALQQAFLIPRKIKEVLCCCLDFSYRGLVHIAVDSGAVINIEARAVFKGEHFYYEYGLNPKLEHIPNMQDDEDAKGNQKPKPRVIASYAVATLPSGVKQFVVLDREKIERARKSSTFPNSLMWKDHYDEGAIKSAIKLLYKQLPQTNRMSEAIHILNQHEGIDLEKPDKAAELEKRFGFEREKKEDTIEGEIILTCPIDDTIADVTVCNKCNEKASCKVYIEIQERIKTQAAES